jgi:hypothetical protein
MRRFVSLLVSVSVGLLQACSPNLVKNIDPDQPLFLSPGAGLITGSVTAPKVFHYWVVARFRYRQLDQSESRLLESATPTSNFLWIEDLPIQASASGPDPGLEQELGRLFAVELPAGTYEIYQLESEGELLIHMPPVRFEVRAGEISYLGNLNVRNCLYRPDQRVYRGYVNAGIPSVRDESQRDLPLLMRKFPALTGASIIPAVIDDAVWQDLENTGLPSSETQCQF